MPARQTTPPSSPACCQHPPLCVPVCTRMGVCQGDGGVQTSVCTPPPPFSVQLPPLCAPPPLATCAGVRAAPHLSAQSGNPGRRTKGMSPLPFLLVTAPTHAKNRTASAGGRGLPSCGPPLCTASLRTPTCTQ